MEILINEINLEIKRLKNDILKMERELKKAPKGTLTAKYRNGKPYPYYQCTEETEGGKARIYRTIGKKEKGLVEKLIRKNFNRRMLPLAKRNLKVLIKAEEGLKPYNPFVAMSEATNLYVDMNISKMVDIDKSKFLAKAYAPDYEKVKAWLEKKASVEDFYPENLKHVTVDGIYMRSKGEVLIAEFLRNRGLAYKYEPEVRINNNCYRPDFGIMRPLDLKIFYWEHFGRLDDKLYEAKAFEKLAEFHGGGIKLWDNLIVTFDMADGSTDVRVIEKMIEIIMSR